ncbi:MAG: hypothetical protein DDT19_01224 [Syntrophomonadaceae bacterium]|nr:hypothetical protein [Bacillota bacterium]
MEKFTPEKEIAARQAEAHPEGQELRREPIPELELTELLKSEKPINEVENNKKLKIEAVRPWNNYTIVTLEGSDEILIFNENARKIDDFKKPQSSKKIVINWRDSSLVRKVGKPEIGRDTTTDPNERKISDVSLELREPARKKLEQRFYFKLSGELQPEEFLPDDMIVLGKYIIFSSRQGTYFAFETQNEHGVVLIPRDWKRIDPSKPYPPELTKYGEKILGEYEGYKQLNEKYSAFVTDVGINIVKNEEAKGAPLFSDNVSSIERNITVDPTNPNIIYYCQSSNPRSIKRIDLSTEPNTWGVITAKLPQKYESVSNLQLDPSGNFFLFYSKEDLVMVTKDGLEEVKRVPKLSQVNFDATGRIRAVDKDGHLVIYKKPNFDELAQEIDKQRVAKLAQDIKIVDIFELEASKKALGQKGGEGLKYLEPPLLAWYEEQFTEVLAKITTPEGAQQLRQNFNKLAEELKRRGLKSNEVAFIISGLEELIVTKEKEFAIKSTQEALVSVRAKLASGLSISSVSEARAEMEKIRGTEALLEGDLREEVHAVALELEQRSLELFRQRGGEIIKDIHGLIGRTKTDLEGFTSKSQMDDWLEFRYPQLKSRLGSLAKDVPLEADEAYKAIVAARTELQAIASTFEDKFKREYAKVREKASERIGAMVDMLAQDVDRLIERLRTKGFTSRTAAEQYLSSSEAKKTLETEIAGLAGDNPDVAKELERGLKVRLSNTLTEIERGALTQVAETGQQMVMFGKTAFPKWEAKVKEKVERKVDLIFEEDAKTHGPNVEAGDIRGDVSISIRTSTGKVEKVRLYEGWQDENEWRFGLRLYRKVSLSNPPSYVSASEYAKIKSEYRDWSQGANSKLKKELGEKQDELKRFYLTRQKMDGKNQEEKTKWIRERTEKLKEYIKFCLEHHIPLLKRVDQIKAEPDIEYSNGKGFIPEWQNHWVMDRQTETDLEEMAKAFKMQLDLQEGILNLKGHAGTGKDVRIKMFCALTHRPYFAIDCTKWTTEFELSEDVMLESKDGASQTIKVPSAVLNGITTPGAMVYFNEFTAMPEQAQIFLHALMDEKRSLTLKTSSGKTIRAEKSVILAASENPGYPGTFAPQFATKSRMVSLEIGYPPLTRKADAGDPNPNAPYDASEALRIARGVDSLADLTYEASLERNEYVKMWDKYINGIDNGAPEPTGTQKFDIDVSLALVQFANNLRENFIKIFEKRREARNALPVSQPITGRELRRAAYALGKMTPEEKATANPEGVARDLLNKYFLTHIDKKEDQDKIRTAMSTWTSKKRVKA